MTTLYDLVRRVGEELRIGFRFQATGGSTTTLIDTNNLGDQFGDDYFNQGTVLVLKTTDGNAPQGEHGIITDYDNATATITIATALTAAIGAGDTVYVMTGDYYYYQIVQAINEAIREQQIVLYDDITIAEGQTEYDMPSGYTGGPVLAYYQTNTGDSDDNRWMQFSGFSIWYDGSNWKFLTNVQLVEDRTVKVKYLGEASELTALTDTLNPQLYEKTVALQAASNLLMQKYGEIDASDGRVTTLIGTIEDKLMRSKFERPIKNIDFLKFGPWESGIGELTYD